MSDNLAYLAAQCCQAFALVRPDRVAFPNRFVHLRLRQDKPDFRGDRLGRFPLQPLAENLVGKLRRLDVARLRFGLDPIDDFKCRCRLRGRPDP
jgi:hypothetical protein